MAFTLAIPSDVINASNLITTNLGCRNDGSDGTQEQQFIGIIGENFIRHYCGLPYMSAEGFDGGYDVTILGKKFDIKTMGRTCYPKLNYVNNFIASQSKFNPDCYMFVSINKLDMKATVCGWIQKHLFNEKAIFYPKGMIRTRSDWSTFTLKADTYEIRNADIRHDFYSFPELFNQIGNSA